jgi:acetyl esterase/lipase
MKFSRVATVALTLAACVSCASPPRRPVEVPMSTNEEIVRVWPGKAPGTEDWTKAESVDQVKPPGAERSIHLVKNVTEPTLTVFRPASDRRATGAGMIVLPGGGWNSLAWDLEGTEIAHWLTNRGITAFVLKYRVYDPDAAMWSRFKELMAQPATPSRFDEFMKLLEPRRQIAVEDAMQAMRVVRSDAQKYGVSADRIGMMGFSAGAITTMSVVLEGDATTRPNFAAPIYGANASDKAPSKDSPPLFVVVAADDPLTLASESVEMFKAWQSAGAPAELHIYESGSHGFGSGKPGTTTAGWTDAFADWLRVHKLIAAQESGQAE